MITRRRAITLIAAAMLPHPALAGEAMPRIAWQGIALGADVRITLLGETALAEQALAAARREIVRMDALFSLAACALALVVGLLAAALPARRAALLDPVQAIRI